MDAHVHWYKVIETIEDYEKLSAEEKQVDCIVAMGGKENCVHALLAAQLKENPKLRFVHSLAAGIEYLVKGDDAAVFRESETVLTNAKGAFSVSLGEFISLGVLYHAKHLERFLERKKEKKWEIEPVEVVSGKTMAVIGYGDIGAACAKIAKYGFGMKCIGVKRNPAACSDE